MPETRTASSAIFDMDDHLGILRHRMEALAALLRNQHCGLGKEECAGAAQVAYDALEAWGEVHALWQEAFNLSRDEPAAA
jgi:hypothetical protein